MFATIVNFFLLYIQAFYYCTGYVQMTVQNYYYKIRLFVTSVIIENGCRFVLLVSYSLPLDL